MDSIAPARTGCPYRPFSRGSLNSRSRYDPSSHAATTCHKCRTHASAAKVRAPRQARSSQSRPTRLCPASAATSPDGDLQAGHSVPTRPSWHQVTSTDGITLSDGEGRERTRSAADLHRQGARSNYGGQRARSGRSVAPGSQREIRILVVPWVVSWIASAECRMLGLFLSLPDRRGAAGGHQLVSCRGLLDAAPGGAVEPQLCRLGRVRVLTSWQTGRAGLGTLRL